MSVETGGYSANGLAGYSKANWTDEYLGDIELEFHSTGVAKGQFKLKNLGLEGSTTTVSGVATGLLASETTYETSNLASAVKVTHDLKNVTTNVNVSAVIGYEGISVGGALALKGSTPSDYNLGAEYATKDLIATLVTSNKGENITGSYYQNVSTATSVGSSLLVKPESGSRLFAFGTSHTVDPSTTVRAKIDSTGIVSKSITHVVTNPDVKFTVSGQYDVFSKSPLQAKKFGVSISLGEY